MQRKPKFKKNQRVYFFNNNEIDYGRIISIIPFKVENEILYYNYTIEYQDPAICSKDRIVIVNESEGCIYAYKKELINHLVKKSEDIEKYFEKALRRRKK